MSGTDPNSRGIFGALRRAAVVVLDVRGRWWLSPRLWFVLMVLAVVCFIGVRDAGSLGGSYGWWLGIIETPDGRRAVGSEQVGDHRVIGGLQLACGYDINTARWTMEVDVSVQRWRGAGRPPTETEARVLLAESTPLQLPPRMFEGERREIQRWRDTTLAEMVASGASSVVERPPLRIVASVWCARFQMYACGAGLGLSVVSWLLRGMQIGAYRQMAKRLEKGLCPECCYDISAHPEGACPECGCDHRARRREARAGLERARA